MGNGRRITKDIFDSVKELHKNGLTNKRIGIVLGISDSSVSRIIKCDSYADFKDYLFDPERAMAYAKKDENPLSHMCKTLDDILSLLKKYMEV